MPYPEKDVDIVKKIDKFLNESMQRHCHMYMAKDKQWYMELASREYGGRFDSTTYGPFSSEEDADDFLNNFSNPGGYSIDDSGKKPVPVKSPNGGRVISPTRRFGRW